LVQVHVVIFDREIALVAIFDQLQDAFCALDHFPLLFTLHVASQQLAVNLLLDHALELCD
jgi:hypothetical protein